MNPDDGKKNNKPKPKLSKNVGVECTHPVRWKIGNRVYQCDKCDKIIDENIVKIKDPWVSGN
jgi:hypothetical protein